MVIEAVTVQVLTEDTFEAIKGTLMACMLLGTYLALWY